MTYYLRSVDNPKKGDSGGMSMTLWYDADGTLQHEYNARPEVGKVIRVGSFNARSFTAQDWWQTSLIEEILEDKENHVKFRTKNSTYEWSIQ